LSGTPLEQWQGRSGAEWSAAWGVPAVEAYGSIGSTNDRALELAADTRNAFGVVVADEQTEGRGRRGATWHSPAGSGLWMSVVLPWPRPVPYVTLLVGLAVAEAIEEAAGGLRVGIKWPNDLVMGARKVGGVLCESAGAAVVAGMGVNLRPLGPSPAEVAQRATSLEVESGKSLVSSVLAGMIVPALRRRALDGLRLEPDVLAQLRARDSLLDTPVDTDEHGRGTARGIGADGTLLLERPDGSRVRVVAGSVRPL
jgi:BirA family biotin operon repressor/biotin-[acetyl-CoA-carboxylase] ligase